MDNVLNINCTKFRDRPPNYRGNVYFVSVSLKHTDSNITGTHSLSPISISLSISRTFPDFPGGWPHCK